MTRLQSSGARGELARTLGPVTLTLIGTGAVVGAGIFVMTGQAASLYAGPAIALSFLLAGLVCAFTGLCYAELAAMIPVAGSAYRYAREAFGERTGWIVGWALVAEYLFAMGAIAIGWSAYMQGVIGRFGISLPAALATSPVAMSGYRFTFTGAVVNLPAVALVAAITLLLLAGTRESARVASAVVAIKMSALALFIAFGLAHVHPGNWSPFIPPRIPGMDGQGAYGIQGVFKGAGVVFFAFLGFDALAMAAQETRNPQRTMPVAILGTLGISVALYVAVAITMTGMIDFHRLNTAAPLTLALAEAGAGLAWLSTYVGVAATIGLCAGLWAAHFAFSRLLFTMSADGLLPASLARASGAAHVPRNAVLAGAVCAMVVAGALPINLLGELISTGTLIAFITVCAALMALRLRQPERLRPFRVPFWRVTPVLGMISSVFVLISLGVPAIERIVAWQAIGAVFYIAQKKHNFKKPGPDSIAPARRVGLN